MKKKIFTTIALCIAISAVAALSMRLKTPAFDTDKSRAQQNSVFPADAKRHEENAMNSSINSVSAPSLQEAGLPASAEELEAMQRELAGIPPLETVQQAGEQIVLQGYFLEEDLLPYNGYSEATLISLGEDGDLRALRVLANRYMHAGDVEKHMDALRKAALHGSTAALMEIGTFQLGMARHSPDEQMREMQLEGLAWFELGIKRGDGYYHVLKERAMQQYQVSLSTDEKKRIEIQALELLSRLQKQRAASGLPALDNSPSPEMVEYYEHVKEMDKVKP